MNSLRIAVVCEGPADHRTATGFGDRLFQEAIEARGRVVGDLAELRIWLGQRGDENYLRWASVKDRVRRSKVVVHGKFGEGSASPFLGPLGDDA